MGGLIQSFFETQKTPELENFKSAKEDITVAYDRAHKLATKIVQRAYPTSDVATLQAFKKKYGSACDVVAKDSCFYFAKIEKETDDIKANDTNAERSQDEPDRNGTGNLERCANPLHERFHQVCEREGEQQRNRDKSQRITSPDCNDDESDNQHIAHSLDLPDVKPGDIDRFSTSWVNTIAPHHSTPAFEQFPAQDIGSEDFAKVVDTAKVLERVGGRLSKEPQIDEHKDDPSKIIGALNIPVAQHNRRQHSILIDREVEQPKAELLPAQVAVILRKVVFPFARSVGALLQQALRRVRKTRPHKLQRLERIGSGPSPKRREICIHKLRFHCRSLYPTRARSLHSYQHTEVSL